MLEAIRIRKAGYSIRIEFDQFVKRYKPILKAYSKPTSATVKEST
jgi:myosin heavy subunit